MLFAAAQAVAVRADDVAFRDLAHEPFGRHQHGPTRRHVEALLAWVAMVKIHLVGLERSAAVLTRNVPEIAQQLDRPSLSDTNTPDLAVAVPTVIFDVVRALAWPHCRGRIIAHLFYMASA